jgi:DNA-binding response OmpR family regulator
VLDSLLADGTGLELCKRIRLNDHSTPILFYSALAFEKDKNEAFRSGAQRYLVKPVDIPVLCDTVAEMLGVSEESNGRGNGNGSSRGAAK